MARAWTLTVLLVLPLAGCGLIDTGGSAAAAASAAAQQAQQARQAEQQVREGVSAAARDAADQRAAAEQDAH
jgi:hypothetical protein